MNLPGASSGVSGAKTVFKRNRGKPQVIDPDRMKGIFEEGYY
jgi:hypothetical protein